MLDVADWPPLAAALRCLLQLCSTPSSTASGFAAFCTGPQLHWEWVFVEDKSNCFLLHAEIVKVCLAFLGKGRKVVQHQQNGGYGSDRWQMHTGFLIAFPVNIGNKHWIDCLVNTRHCTITLLDSLDSTQVFKNLYAYIIMVLHDQSQLISY